MVLCSSFKFELGVDQLEKMLQTEDVTVIDVRENLEQPRIDQFEHIEIPLSRLQDAAAELKTNTIVLFCQSGMRSRQGAQLLDKIFGGSKTIYSLTGGITAG
jgi:rhodanese-related sulfurtransferase